MDADVDRVVVSVLDTLNGNLLFLSKQQQQEVTERILKEIETRLRSIKSEVECERSY